ncbi:acetylornithine transaminase [Corynebacterium sp. UBA2622]|uniref:acetylornithine transaminase n=1 Tax=Corynebacterium sp. UBA2622 TaxID=1946393 RepID=UPI0025C2C9BD|nr:acetylornithine transaminase [Corynebacterium sp. UBA2622]
MSDTLSQWGEVLMNNYGTPSIELVSGRGATVVDSEGNEYIDLLAGIAVNALGHAHPAVVEAVTAQVSSLGHVSNLFASAPAVRLAQRLKAIVGDDSARVFFCNSGAEANEAAFKIARLTGRGRVLAAHHGFHGRTMGALALTGQPDKRAPFEPLVPGAEFYPYGDMDYLRTLVEMNPGEVAAIFAEPIQGETGVIPAPEGFLRGVRELCDEYGILMVVDEVQTGVGRTGDFFAFQHEGVAPDVVTMAKGLGGGFPLGAVIACGPAASLFTPGSHGTTFGGNPVVCAAANAVLDVVDAEFTAAVAAKGSAFARGLGEIDGVAEVRGRGLMLGAVLDEPLAREVVTEGLAHGVILNAPSPSVVRLTPPLVITESEIADATDRIAATLAACRNARSGNLNTKEGTH